jgi:hypothetical protein
MCATIFVVPPQWIQELVVSMPKIQQLPPCYPSSPSTRKLFWVSPCVWWCQIITKIGIGLGTTRLFSRISSMPPRRGSFWVFYDSCAWSNYLISVGWRRPHGTLFVLLLFASKQSPLDSYSLFWYLIRPSKSSVSNPNPGQLNLTTTVSRRL